MNLYNIIFDQTIDYLTSINTTISKNNCNNEKFLNFYKLTRNITFHEILTKISDVNIQDENIIN